jgi:hypothetical protein
VGDAFTSLYANPLGNRVSIDRAFLNELCDDDDKDGGRTEGLSDASIFGKLLIAAEYICDHLGRPTSDMLGHTSNFCGSISAEIDRARFAGMTERKSKINSSPSDRP